ncbi:MAG: gst [Solirubrobacterales bacterium]|nr:gst [Solirubrobacterales bacterium]
MRLVTIPISHYCEKARWALERARIPYREERHVQAIHRIAARRAGGGATVPVLVTPDGALSESEEIIVWADQRTPQESRLFPAAPSERAEVERLCRRFDTGLGRTGRRLMYIHMLAQPKLMLRFNNQGVPPWEGLALRVGWPLAVRWARRELAIRPGIEAEDEAAVWREFDFVAELLADGRKHLCGERFGAADLTFAALSASVVVPPGYGVALPQPAVLPAHTAALVARAREHPAGRYALATFVERRRETVACREPPGGSASSAPDRVGRSERASSKAKQERDRRRMKATELGQTALVGWREKAAAGVARPVSERTGLADEQVRALVGALFFALALYYVIGTLRRALTATRA